MLRNYLGQPVNLASYRGKAVLVTFLYTHCPDVCPLITSNLRVAQNLMGPKVAAKAQIIAVSVDPKGDTPKTVAQLPGAARDDRADAVSRRLRARTRARVEGVGRRLRTRRASSRDFVEHSGLIYGITASGKRTTLYSASFKPADIAHDVPLLAAR